MVQKVFEGGSKAVKLKQNKVYIFDKNSMNGKVNAFREIEKYFEIISSFKMNKHKNERFFCKCEPKRNRSINSFQS